MLGLLLILPVFQLCCDVFPLPTISENRRREAPPELDQALAPAVFINQARKWFDDHYGFRDFLITLKTQIDYSIFGVSDRLYIGRDGWLFYHTVIDNQKPAEEAMTDAELDTCVANFARLRDYLAERNIRLVIITNQLKDKFYPEYLPPFLQGHSAHQRFDDFRVRLRALSGITYIDTTDILMSLKSTRQIFHKTDFHWNDPAAAEVARATVDAIAALEHRPVPFWHYPTTVFEQKFSGGQARELPLFTPLSEIGFFVDPALSPQIGQLVRLQPPFAYGTRGTTTQDDLLPPVVWYGDSFSNSFERAGIMDYFSNYYRVNVTMDTRLGDVLAALPVDARYFVFQEIEVKLPEFVHLSW